MKDKTMKKPKLNCMHDQELSLVTVAVVRKKKEKCCDPRKTEINKRQISSNEVICYVFGD